MKKRIISTALLLFINFYLAGCINANEAATITSSSSIEKGEDDMGIIENIENVDNTKIAYFAGGCFWGMERFMSLVPGVSDVVSGYANGNWDKDTPPTYDEVCSGLTGFKETVKVTYNPTLVSYENLVRAYYIAIDPTVENRQGNDYGEQYQTGVYYLTDEEKSIIERVTDEKRKEYDVIKVEIKPLSNFYDAEQYHQDYLEKNPLGYCHISQEEINEMQKFFEDLKKNSSEKKAYSKPSDEALCKMLSPLEYDVTQNAGTEYAFSHKYYDFNEKGIYVDIVSGEPLFSSEDKYLSSCGWPSFSSAKNESIKYIEDTSHGMVRTEVRSGAADSHLGHVFENDPESPTKTRFCINGASLRFVPYDEMEAQGYSKELKWFEK